MSTGTEVEVKKERKFKFRTPHTYALLFIVLIVAALASYVVPAGEFERSFNEEVERTLVVPGSYASVESNTIGPFELVKAIPRGMAAGSTIIFYIFLVGGAFGIIRATGAIEAGIGKIVVKLADRERLIIPISMLLFSIGGFTIGWAEESIIFVPIGIAIARAMGFDAITGTAMISCGAASGFFGGMLNPFTVGVAQSIAELPLFSGMAFRAVAYVFFLAFGMWYVIRYATAVKKDPKNSVMYEIEEQVKKEEKELNLTSEEIPELNIRHILVFAVLFGGILINIYGVFEWGWYLTELGSSFIAIGIISGLVGGLSLNKTFESFVVGAKALTFGALIVGFARAILVLLEDGRIIDTLINGMVSILGSLPSVITVIGMYAFQIVLNFFIPSGSGQAVTTMPIMVPLADLVGITRQVAVLAYQYGDGITNSIIPTSAALMGYLAIAGIPYEKWFKFIWRLIVGWILIALVFLVIATLTGLQ
ncbi:MAG: C4-dicarboxylate ABC transporter permease [Desulfitibacter sp. BRH_c19]|nr:MAG: C4-dicarboxylate ABC transporter permease [Desulfitibacter sp. BRH_c19]